jgi:hypothetical protein
VLQRAKSLCIALHASTGSGASAEVQLAVGEGGKPCRTLQLLEALAGPAGVVAACSAVAANTLAGEDKIRQETACSLQRVAVSAWRPLCIALQVLVEAAVEVQLVLQALTVGNNRGLL